MYCNNCGKELEGTPQFCPYCGSRQYVPNETAQNIYSTPSNQPVPGKSFAIASMVLGIVAFFCYGIITGVLAIVFGRIAMSKGYTGNMARAGFICGIVALALYVFVLVLAIVMGTAPFFFLFGF